MRRIGLCALLLVWSAEATFAQTTESVATITTSVPPGNYNSDQLVSLAGGADASLFFTFGESRDRTFTPYTVPILLNALEGEIRSYTLRVEARAPQSTSRKKEFTYIIDKRRPPLPKPSLESNTYLGPIEIDFDISTLSSDDTLVTFVSGVTGPAPWDGVPIQIAGVAGETAAFDVGAYVVDRAGNRSDLGQWRYVIDRTTVTERNRFTILSPIPGTFENRQFLYVESDHRKLLYTLNGDDPVSSGTEFTEPFLIERSGLVQLRVAAVGDSPQEVEEKTVTFEVIGDSIARFLPASGVYDSELTVTLDGADPTYTLNESDPVSAGIVYSAPLRIALLRGSIRHVSIRFMSDSEATERRYFYVLDDRSPPNPILRLSERIPLREPALVTIDHPPHVTVFLTADGTTPGRSNSVYDGAFEIEIPEGREAGSIILKAVAVGANGRESEVASLLATYDLDPPSVPQITYLGRSGADGVAVGVESEFGSQIHYEISLDDSEPPDPDVVSPVSTDSLRLDVPYGMERMFTLKFAASDSAGNMSDPTQPFRLLVDRVSPPPPEIDVSDGKVVISSENRVYYTSTADGSRPGVPTKTSLEYSDPIPIFPPPDGRRVHRYRAIAVDTSGNESQASEIFDHVFDARRPQLPPISGVVDNMHYQDSVRIGFTRSDPEIAIRYSVGLNEEATAPSSGSTLLTSDSLVFAGVAGESTEYSIKFLPQLLSNGNIGEVESIRFTIDRDPPLLPEIDNLRDGMVLNSVFIIEPPDDYPDRLFIAIEMGSDSVPDPLGDEGVEFIQEIEIDVADGTAGDFAIALGAIDPAGNRVFFETPVGVTIDREAPVPPVISGIPSSGVAREPVTLVMSSPDASVTYSLSSVGESLSDESGELRRYTAPIVVAGEEGKELSYIVRGVAVDAAGNESGAAYGRLTIDRLAPPPPVAPDIWTGPGDLLMSWPHEEGHRIYYRLNIDVNNAFEVFELPETISIPDSLEQTSVSYYSRDIAGNQSGVQHLDIVLARERSEQIFTGVEDRATYNSRRRLARVNQSGVVRYSMRDDGVDPGAVTAYSPVMPEFIDLDVAVGETNRYVIRFAYYSDSADSAPLSQELVQFVVDRSPPPEPQIVLEEQGFYFRTDSQFQLTAGEGEVFVSLNGREFSRYTAPITLSAADGTSETYRIRAYSRDNAENRSATTEEWTIVVDKSNVYVSVEGNDLFVGSRSRPFRTLERALADSLTSNRRQINIASGSYLIREPLLVEHDLTLVGGLDPDTWESSGVETPTVLQAAADIETALLRSTGVNITLNDLTISSTPQTSGGPMIEVDSGDLKLQSVQIRTDRVHSHPLIRTNGGVFEMKSSAIAGAVDDGAIVDVSQASRVLIVDSLIAGGEVQGSMTSLGFAQSSDIQISTSTIRGGRARASSAIAASESTLLLTDVRVSAGIGRATATGISLFDSTLTAQNTLIEGAGEAWIGSCIDSEFSNLILSHSTLVARGDRGGVAISAEGTSIEVDSSIIRGGGGEEFIYLLQLSNTTGTITNSMLSSSQSRDIIGLDLNRSPISMYHNTINLAEATNLSVGIRVQSGIPPYLVNNLIAGTGSSDLTVDAAIQLLNLSRTPRLLGNGFGGFADLVHTEDRRYGTVDALNSSLDGDPLGGSVQLNIEFDPVSTLNQRPDDTISTSPDSDVIDKGFDLGLIGLRLPLDFDGEARPQGRSRSNAAYDIGADEVR